MDCAAETSCVNGCSGQGVCQQGACSCDLEWAGVDCSTPRSCPRDCSGKGMCKYGKCYCEPGASGVDCALPVGCHASPPAYMPALALVEQGAQPTSGVGVDGSDASAALVAHAPTAAEECGGKGVCQYGRCFCEPGHYGHNCTLPIACPRDCGGEEQGVCANGRCYCTVGWSGDDCTTQEACPASAGGRPCGGRGRCGEP